MNLDALSVSELKRLVRGKDMSEKQEDYARCKIKAMERRLKGFIQEAMAYESECDRIYDKLPPDDSW